jgi:hypothetical protein
MSSATRVRQNPKEADSRTDIADLVQSRRQGPRSLLQRPHPENSEAHRCHRPCHQCFGRQCASDSSCVFADVDLDQVQGEAQGSNDAIKQFLEHINEGPSAARVTGVEHFEISTKSGESGFSVK